MPNGWGSARTDRASSARSSWRGSASSTSPGPSRGRARWRWSTLSRVASRSASARTPAGSRRPGLDRIGLAGRFDVVLSSAEVGRPKPAPDVYLEVARRLGADPAEAIGFEDSPAGVEALRSAGIVTIGVLGGSSLDLGRADLVVDLLTDVLGWPGARPPAI